MDSLSNFITHGAPLLTEAPLLCYKNTVYTVMSPLRTVWTRRFVYLFIYLFIILNLLYRINITEKKRKNIYITKIANLQGRKSYKSSSKLNLILSDLNFVIDRVARKPNRR